MSPDADFRRYWSFFWPLALNGIFLLIGQQVFNGVLARYPDPARELAVYSYAIGIVFLFDIGTAFMPNLVTVYARSVEARRRVLGFCFAIGASFTAPVMLIGMTAAGHRILGYLYSIDGAMLADVALYLSVLSGSIFLHITHHYLNGLLIQQERTPWVSGIGIAGVGIALVVALFGFRHGWKPVWIIGAAEWISGLFKLGVLLLIWRRIRLSLPPGEGPLPTYRELMGFFWPVCVSGMTFGFSRPLLFMFVSRVPGAVGIVAALRVSMDFLMLFQAVVNQFRHFFATFGLDDLAGKRRFMAVVAAVMTTLMATVLLTPLRESFFVTALGLGMGLYADATYMSLLLLVVPSILMVRNYYHGILIVRKRTTAMATGSAARIAAIAGSGALLLATGMLGARTAVLGMIAGFLAEMVIAWLAVRRISPTQ